MKELHAAVVKALHEVAQYSDGTIVEGHAEVFAEVAIQTVFRAFESERQITTEGYADLVRKVGGDR